jgi:hypothetical protein
MTRLPIGFIMISGDMQHQNSHVQQNESL